MQKAPELWDSTAHSFVMFSREAIPHQEKAQCK